MKGQHVKAPLGTMITSPGGDFKVLVLQMRTLRLQVKRFSHAQFGSLNLGDLTLGPLIKLLTFSLKID